MAVTEEGAELSPKARSANARFWGYPAVRVALPALQKNFVNIFFVFAWEFCIEKWRGFLVNFFWSPSPTKRSTKNPRKIRGKFGAKFGAKFGTKIRKIRETFVLQLFYPAVRGSLSFRRRVGFGPTGDHPAPKNQKQQGQAPKAQRSVICTEPPEMLVGTGQRAQYEKGLFTGGIDLWNL